MSAFSGNARNLYVSAYILPNLGFSFMKYPAGSKFRVFLKLEILEFGGFHGFLSEFSA